jgi:D-arabinose 1-dehydrogenase-like Zn-dependent alcohol dehydrogenase
MIRDWVSGPARSKSGDAVNFNLISGVLPMIEVFPVEKAQEVFEKMLASKIHFHSLLKIN